MSDETEPATPDVAEFMAEMTTAVSRQRQQAVAAFTAICSELTELGVEQLQVSYDGYGDSGTIDTITATAGEQVIPLSDELQQRIDDATCDLLPSAWQDNSGSCGEVVLDVGQRQITIDHRRRYEEYDLEEETIELSPATFAGRKEQDHDERL